MAISYLSNMSIDGTLTLTVNADDATYTGIVTVDGGTLKYRTKAQIKSDIGAGSGDGTVTGVTGTAPISSSGGTAPDISISNATGTTVGAAAIEAGTGISVSDSNGVYTITNSSPSSGGTVTSVGATAPVTSSGGNTPTIGVDTAAVSSGSSKLATGTQIQTAIDNAVAGLGSGTVTSVGITAGTGISVSGSPITSSGSITVTNSAPDQTVALSAGTGISISGTYPNFTITNSSPSSGGTVGGSGTANKVAKFTAGSTIGDGPITFSSNDSTFSGTVEVDNMLKISIDDISTGENRGLQLYNENSSGQQWNLTAGRAGQENTSFVVRDSSNDVDALVINEQTNGTTPLITVANGGDTTFSANVTIGSDSATAPTLFINKVASGTSEIKFQNQGGEKASLQLDSAEDFQIFANTGQKIILRSGGADTLTLNASQGANFESDVEANGSITGATVGSSTQDAANIFKGSVISSVATNSLGLILRNSSDNAIIGSLLRTSASTSELTTDTLSLPGTTSQYIRGDGSVATFPSTGVSGSGTSGKVAKFTGSTSIGDGDITFGTNTITLGDPTSSSTATLFVDTQNRRVGYRTINPTSAFEVVGTINTQGLNCNEKQFFSPKDNNYIQAGNYGSGDFFGNSGFGNSDKQPKFSAGWGNSGIFVEHQKIETIKIQQNGFYNWFTNGCILIPAQGTNTFIFVDSITVYKSAGSNPNMGQVYFGFCEQASPTSNCQMFGNAKSFQFWGSIASQVTSRSGTWTWQSDRPYNVNNSEAADTASLLNRPFVARVGQNAEVSSGTFNGPWYIQIKYRNVNYLAGFVNNVDRTITSTGSGQNSRTQFLGSSVTNFSTICPANANVPPDANQSYHFDNTSGCNGNNGYPASGDKVYTSATGSTVAAAGYIYLYSGGGARYYIQIGSGGVVQGSSCTDSVSECDQPES